MPTDTLTLIGMAVGAIVVIWLVFSVLKKVIGFVVLAAIFVAAFILWTNPGLLDQVLAFFGR